MAWKIAKETSEAKKYSFTDAANVISVVAALD